MSRVPCNLVAITIVLAFVSVVTAINECCLTNTDCRQVDKNVDIICVREVNMVEMCVIGHLMPKNCRWRRHWFGSWNSPKSAQKECFIKHNCAENLGWYRHDIGRDGAYCYTRDFNPGWKAARDWYDATPNC